ncbi:peptide chain release factor N(5)-glutamine methyltransferase [bacterium]|nr:peptide chain release factor N(5)-glutamine methyltransferase [bacterium]
MTVTRIDLFRKLAASLKENPEQEAQWILAHVLGIDQHQLLSDFGAELSVAHQAECLRIQGERLAGKPLAYVLGESEFWGRKFKVSPAVLIPRPETEELVELALKYLANTGGVDVIIDVGTGSGVIAITLALESNTPKVYGLEISPEALVIARQNAALNVTEFLGKSTTLTFLESNLLEKLDTSDLGDQGVKRALIVANLPYVSTTEELPVSVIDFEPKLALFAESDGLALVERLLVEVQELASGLKSVNSPKALLPEETCIFLEIGYTQANRVVSTALKLGYGKTEIFQDLSGKDRFVLIKR